MQWIRICIFLNVISKSILNITVKYIRFISIKLRILWYTDAIHNRLFKWTIIKISPYIWYFIFRHSIVREMRHFINKCFDMNWLPYAFICKQKILRYLLYNIENCFFYYHGQCVIHFNLHKRSIYIKIYKTGNSQK